MTSERLRTESLFIRVDCTPYPFLSSFSSSAKHRCLSRPVSSVIDTCSWSGLVARAQDGISEWGCYQTFGALGDGSPSAMNHVALSHLDDLPYSSSELRGLLPIRYVQSLSISMPPRPASARRASGCAASTTAPTPACAPPPPPLSYDRSASPSSAPISATPSAV